MPNLDAGDSEHDSLLAAVAAAPPVDPAMVARLRPGNVIRERYTLERWIGEGGMGIVWAANDGFSQGSVALKFLKQSAASPTARRRFLREARTAGAIQHPNVVEILDVFELDDGFPVMVMELLEGEPLASRMERQGRLSLHETLRIMLPVVSAVGSAHAAGVVHRDLKPHNIFLCSAKGSETVKVLDFGIAKLIVEEASHYASTSLTGTGALVGTPCYMSPEQAFGEQNVDHRADVWALGIILYQCLSGVLPTKADNVGQVLKVIVEESIEPLESLAPDVPRDIARLVASMLERKPEARPADLRDVQAVLAAHVKTSLPSFGPAIPAQQELPRRKRRLVYLALIPVAIAAGLILWRSEKPEATSPQAPPEETATPRSAEEATGVVVVPEQVPSPKAQASAPAHTPTRPLRRDAGSAPAVPSSEPSAPARRPDSDRLPGGVVQNPPF